MRHITEAYDLLVDELKQKIDMLISQMNAQSHEATIISGLLTRELVRHAGKDVAMKVAREIDKQFDAGFAEWVDVDFVDQKNNV